ncbi:tryptophan--tRNA ligase, mitochondrial [Atheta coriaria]|uniref:tryptophan--tRNA ligase, mitochondrial n=1 Tax=Dalotia coriaria TaxID=877792 RepID=UPI0031F3837D
MLKNKSKILLNNLRTYSNNASTTKKIYPQRIFSGIQPTGSVHIGNYLGAITNWLKYQNQGDDIMLSVVDLHSITLPQNPKDLSKNILTMTATLLACGIDPEKSILFQQSHVPQHTELCWQLGCICTMARLAHLPQYKEKSENLKDIPLGLFVYPVLQAADILLYKSTHVPVGEDQIQQIQLAQELARMFNNHFGETFPIPHSIVSSSLNSRLKSLRNPDKKMSKSEPDAKSRITLLDTDDEIRNKFKKAVTDFTSTISYDPEKRPGVSNLVAIHSELTGKSIEEIVADAKHLDTLGYKLLVGEEVAARIRPIREKIIDYSSDPLYIMDVLKTGAEKASEIAERTAKEVRRKMGFNIDVKKKKSKKVAAQ